MNFNKKSRGHKLAPTCCDCHALTARLLKRPDGIHTRPPF